MKRVNTDRLLGRGPGPAARAPQLPPRGGASTGGEAGPSLPRLAPARRHCGPPSRAPLHCSHGPRLPAAQSTAVVLSSATSPRAVHLLPRSALVKFSGLHQPSGAPCHPPWHSSDPPGSPTPVVLSGAAAHTLLGPASGASALPLPRLPRRTLWFSVPFVISRLLLCLEF
jgi:hypothetical protein